MPHMDRSYMAYRLKQLAGRIFQKEAGSFFDEEVGKHS